MPHEVFISHAADDARTAEAVCDALERGGVGCWMASRDIVGGNYAEAIIKAINASRVMVLIFSSHANRSRHVVNEVERAHSKGVIIYPFRVEDVPPSEALEYFISSTQMLDASEPPFEKHLKRLSQNVARMLGKSPAAQFTSAASSTSAAPVTSAVPSRKAYEYDAFISVSVWDLSWAELLQRHLAERGFNCCLDDGSARGKNKLNPSAQDALSKSRHLIVLWSDAAWHSDWVETELARFRLMIAPHLAESAETDRRVVVIALADEPAGMSKYAQIITELVECRAYEDGIEKLAPDVWGRVINKVSEALSH